MAKNSQDEDDKSFLDENSVSDKANTDKEEKNQSTEEKQNSKIEANENQRKFQMQKHSLDSGNGEKNLEHFDMKMDTALMFINECLNENVD